MTGLFQQTVVLVRQTVLYRLIHRDAPLSEPQREAVADRRARLLDKASQGVETLSLHRAALTPAGETVRAEAAVLLSEESARLSEETGLLSEEAAREGARAGRPSGGGA
ncbi:hypothetical protein [Streptomyces sp. NPDC060184]|uniref:hypothetical protein n=1 Tax=Streptomyces sp. NPDC060184 TaxID=3347064 RepID=UPI00365119DA